MKDRTMNEKAIHIILHLVDNPKSIGKIIADKTNLSASDVSKNLNKLKEMRIVDNETCSPQDDKKYTGKCWSVIPDFRVLRELIDRIDHDRTAPTAFMRSHYYRAMVPDLIRQFKDLIPESDLWKFATHHHTATSEQPFTQADEYLLTDSLKTNWLALKFVTHFISVSLDERTTIIDQLIESTSNPYISPSAARCDECKKCFCGGMDACQLLISDDKEAMWREKRMKAEMDTVSRHINLREFFHQLDHLNTSYTYLFNRTTIVLTRYKQQ